MTATQRGRARAWVSVPAGLCKGPFPPHRAPGPPPLRRVNLDQQDFFLHTRPPKFTGFPLQSRRGATGTHHSTILFTEAQPPKNCPPTHLDCTDRGQKADGETSPICGLSRPGSGARRGCPGPGWGQEGGWSASPWSCGRGTTEEGP